jgi:hypothetical protein
VCSSHFQVHLRPVLSDHSFHPAEDEEVVLLLGHQEVRKQVVVYMSLVAALVLNEHCSVLEEAFLPLRILLKGDLGCNDKKVK